MVEFLEYVKWVFVGDEGLGMRDGKVRDGEVRLGMRDEGWGLGMRDAEVRDAEVGDEDWG